MKRENKMITRFMPLLIILVVLMVAIVSLLNAYYIKNSNDVTNNFIPAVPVNPTVEEAFDGTKKENVYFKVGDTGYPVYVRAKIVITWKNEDGVVYFKPPKKGADYDYTIDLNLNDWTEGSDGYYYYKEKVESNGQTSYLINKCVQLNSAVPPAEGYSLSVELIVQTIQAIGNTDDSSNNPAWKDATWEDTGWVDSSSDDSDSDDSNNNSGD